MLTKTNSLGEVTSYQYDAANRLVAMSNPAYLQVSYHYDNAGRLIDRILSNGTRTSYSHDADGRLIGLVNVGATGNAVEHLVYQHDEVGNIVRIEDAVSGRVVDYDYDGLYRLTLVDSTPDTQDRVYSYDAVGNRKTETRDGITYYYCYHSDCTQGPQGNRLLSIRLNSPTGAIHRSFSYDDAGRVTEKRDDASLPLYSIDYNGKGRAKQIGYMAYEYDPNDYRIQNGDLLHLLEGEHLEAIYWRESVRAKYLRGAVIDEVVSGYLYDPFGDYRWPHYNFHHDHLNSVTAVTGHAGDETANWQYDAFGAELGTPTTIPNTALRYTGRELDEDTGLYYYRARYYDPEIGRFISEDPLGFEAGINFYAYVDNNPVNYSDPMGLEKQFQLSASLSAFLGQTEQTERTVIRYDPNACSTTALCARYENLPHRNAWGGGGSGGSAIGISVGDSFWDTQFYYEARASLLDSGDGGFLGIGLGLDGSSTAGPLPVGLSLHEAAFRRELNAGLYYSGGLSWEKDNAGKLTSAGLSGGKAGYGFGLMDATGGSSALRIATPTFGQMWDYAAAAVSDFFGDSQATPSASGGFVLYPSKPNTNMLRQVYSK